MFLAVSVQNASVSQIIELVAKQPSREALFAKDASGMPISVTARGKWRDAGSVLLYEGSSAASLFGLTKPRTKNNDRREDLVAVVRRLVETHDCYVAFVFHWYHGLLTKEEVPDSGEVRVNVWKLGKLMDNLQEDVRYVISPEGRISEKWKAPE
jgi:hypothetical protein